MFWDDMWLVSFTRQISAESPSLTVIDKDWNSYIGRFAAKSRKREMDINLKYY